MTKNLKNFTKFFWEAYATSPHAKFIKSKKERRASHDVPFINTNPPNGDAPLLLCSRAFIPRCLLCSSTSRPHLSTSPPTPCGHGHRRRCRLGAATMAAVGQAPGRRVPGRGRRGRRRVGGVRGVRGPRRRVLPGHGDHHGGVGGDHAAAPAVALPTHPPEQRLRPRHRTHAGMYLRRALILGFAYKEKSAGRSTILLFGFTIVICFLLLV